MFRFIQTKSMTAIKSKYFRSNTETMDKRILAYLNQLEPPIDIELPGKNIQWLYPFKNPETCRCMEAFYSKYYSDTQERILILGINPGRFGSGITGIISHANHHGEVNLKGASVIDSE